MGQHLRGKLGPAGRAEIARLQLDEGLTERAAAAALSVAPAPRDAGSSGAWASAEELASGSWTRDRSSRPHRCPRQTPAELERRVCEARERTGWGPRLLVAETGVAHSTISAILKRHGCSRAPRPDRSEVVRYEWPCPGDLLHMDVKRYPRFRRPGHAVTGDRRAKLQPSPSLYTTSTLSHHNPYLLNSPQTLTTSSQLLLFPHHHPLYHPSYTHTPSTLPPNPHISPPYTPYHHLHQHHIQSPTHTPPTPLHTLPHTPPPPPPPPPPGRP